MTARSTVGLVEWAHALWGSHQCMAGVSGGDSALPPRNSRLPCPLPTRAKRRLLRRASLPVLQHHTSALTLAREKHPHTRGGRTNAFARAHRTLARPRRRHGAAGRVLLRALLHGPGHMRRAAMVRLSRACKIPRLIADALQACLPRLAGHGYQGG